MKRKRPVISAIFMAVTVLLLSGCLEYKVVTQIMEDGSILRTVTIRGDSSLIFEKAYPQYKDAAWEITTRYESQDEESNSNDEVFVLEATRTFPDVQSLNNAVYSGESPSTGLNMRVDLQKHFKWFYSQFEYTETYLMRFPFRSRSIHEFLTLSELRVYNAEDDLVFYDPARDSLDVAPGDMVLPSLTREDSLRSAELKENLELKYEEWAKMNLFDAFYAELETAFATLDFVPGAGMGKEDLYQWLDSNRVFEDVFEEPEVLLDSASWYYNLDPSGLHAANSEGLDSFSSRIAEMNLDLDSFTHQVLMPGMVIQTNAVRSDGNLVEWNFTTNDFYATDYTMTVRSRDINRWMIVVSAGIIFLIIGLLITSLAMQHRK